MGEIQNSSYDKILRHQLFIDTGIDTAVRNLIELEKEEGIFLAFSIGGTIAWKAALHGLKIKELYAVSSTRLRYEQEKPGGRIKLFYGEKDEFSPTPEWFEKFNLTPEIIKNGNHLFYSKKKHSTTICESLKNSFIERNYT